MVDNRKSQNTQFDICACNFRTQRLPFTLYEHTTLSFNLSPGPMIGWDSPWMLRVMSTFALERAVVQDKRTQHGPGVVLACRWSACHDHVCITDRLNLVDAVLIGGLVKA